MSSLGGSSGGGGSSSAVADAHHSHSHSHSHAISTTIAEDTKNRRSSKRVANAAAHGKRAKQEKQEKLKKLKKPLCAVDFAKLEMSSLLKYKRHFKLPVRPGAPKHELISSIRKHFVHHPRLRDVDVIAAFLYANQQQKAENKKALQAALQAQQEAKNAAAAAAAAKQAGRS